MPTDSKNLYSQALPRLTRAQELAQEANDPATEALAWLIVGITYRTQGLAAASIAPLQRSLALARQVGKVDWEVLALNAMGDAHRDLAQYDLALRAHNESLAIDRRLGRRNTEVADLLSIATTYEDIGRAAEGLELSRQAAAIAREILPRATRPMPTAPPATACWRSAGRPMRWRLHRQSLALHEKNRSAEGIAGDQANMAGAYLDLGQYGSTLELLGKALEYFRGAGNRMNEAIVLGQTGGGLSRLRPAVTCARVRAAGARHQP